MRLNKLLAALLVSISFLFAPFQSAYALDNAQTYTIAIFDASGTQVGQTKTVSYNDAKAELIALFNLDERTVEALLSAIADNIGQLGTATAVGTNGYAVFSSGGGTSASPAN